MPVGGPLAAANRLDAATLASSTPMAVAQTDSAEAPKTSRLDSVDILRGLVMVLMALDHTRGFFSSARFDPTDLSQTSAALFVTRWITHFCAPVFVFIAGAGAFLSTTRGKSVADLSRFLWTRGLMLVVFEFTIVRFGWAFQYKLDFFVGQVIWALGVSMVCLAALVRLPLRFVAIFGVGMIFGHNALDSIRPETLGAMGWIWKILHVNSPIRLTPNLAFMPAYPLIPWIGVMAAGYAFGSLFSCEAERRKRIFLVMGLVLTFSFFLIRGLNGYGNPNPWSEQKSPIFTVLSFFNTTKYPPSLDYLLMTLGPAIFALAFLEKGAGALGRFLVVIGRVPMFYYILHLYLIHGLAVIMGAVQRMGDPKARGFDLPWIYLVWVIVVLVLYPLCKWYGALKRRRKDVWLSYL